MKIIEAMKKIGALTVKSQDLRLKISHHCADLDYETPIYPNQREVLDGWLQAHKDIIREIGALKYRLQKTNVMTPVTINIGGNEITKSITEWIDRRRTLSALEKQAWDALSNRGLKEGIGKQSTGMEVHVKVRYYYDPKQKDKMQETLKGEPSEIDGRLEIINAITDLLE